MSQIFHWTISLIPLVGVMVFAGSPQGAEAPLGPVKDPSTADLFGKPVAQIGDGDLKLLRSTGGILQLELRGSRVTDAGLREIASVPGLQRLWLEGTEITDKGLEGLKGLKDLRILGLERTRLTDQGLVSLKGLGELKLLLVQGTRITEAGVIELERSLPDCRIVWDKPIGGKSGPVVRPGIGVPGVQGGMQGPGMGGLPPIPPKFGPKRNPGPQSQELFGKSADLVRDEDLEKLKGKQDIFYLDLAGSAITDEGLRVLSGLVNLEVLNLAWTRVTDEGLRRLGSLKRLRTLGLEGTRVTGVGFEHLGGLNDLTVLELEKTHLSMEGLEAIRSLSGLKVLFVEGASWDPAKMDALRRGPRACQVYFGKKVIGPPEFKKTLLNSFVFGGGSGELLTDLDLLVISKQMNGRPGHDNFQLGSHVTVGGLRILADSQRPKILMIGKVLGLEAGSGYLRLIQGLNYLTLKEAGVSAATWAEVAELNQLKYLNLEGKFRVGGSLETIAKLVNLEGVRLAECGVNDDDLSFLGQMKGLKYLAIEEKSVDGSILSRLGKLEGLITLDLSDSGITDTSLSGFHSGKTLKHITLRRTGVSDRGLAHLKQFKDLQKLYLGGTKITDAGLAHIGSMENVMELDLSGTQITTEGLKSLRGCKKLRQLNLRDCPITDEAVDVLLGMKSINTLSVVRTRISKEGLARLHANNTRGVIPFPMENSSDPDTGTGGDSLTLSGAMPPPRDPEFFKKIKGKRQLTIDFPDRYWNEDTNGFGFRATPMPLEDLLGHLKEIKDLTTLIIEESGPQSVLTDQDLELLGDMPNLKSLQLRASGLTDECMVYLRKLKGLTHLDISQTRLTDQGLSSLKDLPNLERVELPDTVLGPGLAVFADLPRFRRLRIGAEVGNQGIVYLEKCHKLGSLDLSGTRVTPVAMARLSGLKRLEVLSFSDGVINSQNLDFVVAFPNLKSFSLKGCEVNSEMARKICRLKKLEFIHFLGCNLGEGSLKPLIDLEKLTFLGMQNTRINQKESVVLREMLGLDHLILAGSTVTPGEFLQLKALLGNTNLAWYDWEVAPEPPDIQTGNQQAELVKIPGLARRFPIDSKLIIMDALRMKLENPGLTRESFEKIKEFKNLTHLDLDFASLPDERLEFLRDLPLEYLSLQRTSPGEKCFPYLVQLKNLKDLRIGYLEITEKGMADLGRLKGLKQLRMVNTFNLTGKGLAHLKGLRGLEGLEFIHCDLDDQGIAQIASLNQITELKLHYCKVTDKGLAHLQGMTNLVWLNLSRTQVTDAGLKHLKNLKTLKRLELQGLGLTQAGLEDLRKALAGCKVIWR